MAQEREVTIKGRRLAYELGQDRIGFGASCDAVTETHEALYAGSFEDTR